MASEDEQQIREVLGVLGRFSAEAIADARVTRLQGLTNRVYKVEAAGERVCVRIPGAGTAEIIDRAAEEAHARAAAEIGVAPAVLHFGPDGVMATRFVEAETLSAERFRTRGGAVERTALALRLLHDTTSGFTRSFDVFGTVERYAGLLSRRGAEPPNDFGAALGGAERIRQVLAARPAEERPCHCDPTDGNLLDTGARVFLIDWEYSARNDPMWDLAYLSVEGAFDAELDRRMFEAYLGRAPARAETGRLEIYKALTELLAALWAMIQHASGNPAADFRAYAEAAFARCGVRMRASGFEAHLEAVRAG